MSGVVWAFAGGMLIQKGFSAESLSAAVLLRKIGIGLSGGLLFYFLLFTRISRKHTHRIHNLESNRPGLFSFFSARSYLMMILMISIGTLLRKTGIIPSEILSVFYVVMGTPLLMSAFRFFYSALGYKNLQ
jgi:hypothetical protein